VRGESSELADFGGITRREARAMLQTRDLQAAKHELLQAILGAASPFEGTVRSPRLGAGGMTHSSSGIGVELGLGQCPICMDTLDSAAMLECTHLFCRECLEQFAKSEIDQGKVDILCPLTECKTPLQHTEIRELVGALAFERLDRRAVDDAVLAEAHLYRCATADCTFIAEWNGYAISGEPRFRCPRCDVERCLLCGVSPYHDHATCQEAKDAKARHGGLARTQAEEAASLEFIERDATIKRCRRCGNGVAKSEGCNKMKCRCGFRFCFACGAENCVVNGKNCGCTPASHGFVDQITGRGEFNGLRAEASPS